MANRYSNPAEACVRQDDDEQRQSARPPFLVSAMYDGRPATLICENTGEVMRVGAQVESLRGEVYLLSGGAAPHKQGSTGRVYVKDPETGHENSFYPSVFGLKWATD